jgi:hypothetical protein
MPVLGIEVAQHVPVRLDFTMTVLVLTVLPAITLAQHAITQPIALHV